MGEYIPQQDENKDLDNVRVRSWEDLMEVLEEHGFFLHDPYGCRECKLDEMNFNEFIEENGLRWDSSVIVDFSVCRTIYYVDNDESNELDDDSSFCNFMQLFVECGNGERDDLCSTRYRGI